ncbi:MAG: hypothetical protein HY036_06370 [Nitrospirae bacterium]|nr:hypothetical protein [Nitrospirota bacterium]MBI3352185.1 hypothetical protein [Nitrospirota bacterium]
MKKYGIAALLSALIPGAGQLYNHQWLKGILFMAAAMILGGELRRNIPMSAFTAGKPLAHSGLFLFLAVVVLGISAWSVIDAYQISKKKTS